MRIGNHSFDFDQHAYIMGILNITPDSFSDGGRFLKLDRALYAAENMIGEGASIIDVGGESTRPGYVPVSAEEEISRICPVIEKISKTFDTVISADTSRAAAAKAAIEAGADMVNDIWGLQGDAVKKNPMADRIAETENSTRDRITEKKSPMADRIAQSGVPCVLMHNRKDQYKEFLKDFCEDMDRILEIADKAGIKRDKIILDPGIGFGKSYEQNLAIMNHLDIMKQWGLPVLLGTSRKSVIGKALDLPADERLEGTIATTVIGYMKGARLFRVHDVKENMRALKMAEAVARAYREGGFQVSDESCGQVL